MLVIISQTHVSIIIWFLFLIGAFWILSNTVIKYQVSNTENEEEETFYIPTSKLQAFAYILNTKYPNSQSLTYMQLTEAWNEFLAQQNHGQ